MIARLVVILLCSSYLAPTFAAADIEAINSVGKQRIHDGATAQREIDALNDATADKVEKYKMANKLVHGLNTYNTLLEAQINNQNNHAASITSAIKDVGEIERQIIPLMVDMIDSIAQIVELDVPFLLEERRARVRSLQKMMLRADISVAEKFRRTFEAYQVEADYGRTIEAYKGSMTFAGRTREVDFLRIGRVALLYQTIGRDSTGAWDVASADWLELSAADYKQSVAQGMRIARKQIAPDMLVIPLAAAHEVKQ